MTSKNQHMYNEFQLVYNNLESNQSAGLDTFEISSYLTDAYHAYVTSLYGKYEKEEDARKALLPLVKTVTIPKYAGAGFNTDKISDDSVFFDLDNNETSDILYVVYEALKMNSKAEPCMRNKLIEIIPVTHDEFHNIKNNPFRYNNRRALRMDFSLSDGKRIAEVITKDKNCEYYVRYIRKPKPIILKDLTPPDIIQGMTTETECELDEIYFKDIVRIAAEMAANDYKTR